MESCNNDISANMPSNDFMNFPFFFSPYVVKYYGSYFKNTDLWVDINDFHLIFLQ